MFTIEDLYWAGFLAADGCVDDDGRVRIYLHRKDVEHLEKFKAYTGKPHKIQTPESYPDRCAFEFTDRDMVKWLNDNFNIVPRKSLVYEFPTWMSVEDMSHFLRGYFDGDGCICESFSNRASRTATLYATVTGSDPAIDFVYQFLLKTLAITGPVQRRAKYTKTGNPYSTVKYSTKKSAALLKYMYSNSTYSTRLNRKYDLYYNIVVMDNRLTR